MVTLETINFDPLWYIQEFITIDHVNMMNFLFLSQFEISIQPFTQTFVHSIGEIQLYLATPQISYYCANAGNGCTGNLA